ncbi:Ger(x)C family spore germination C-terminal domain-containing protein [Paenibacillus amylolyticus]|nr:Ger(x)C family spore germination C-terminal domain-containing protein [Paenibacillus amylolyticus]
MSFKLQAEKNRKNLKGRHSKCTADRFRYIRFGEAFHRKYPYEWHKWKEDWTRKFQHLQVDVNLRYRLN